MEHGLASAQKLAQDEVRRLIHGKGTIGTGRESYFSVAQVHAPGTPSECPAPTAIEVDTSCTISPVTMLRGKGIIRGS